MKKKKEFNKYTWHYHTWSVFSSFWDMSEKRFNFGTLKKTLKYLWILDDRIRLSDFNDFLALHADQIFVQYETNECMHFLFSDNYQIYLAGHERESHFQYVCDFSSLGFPNIQLIGDISF